MVPYIASAEVQPVNTYRTISGAFLCNIASFTAQKLKTKQIQIIIVIVNMCLQTARTSFLVVVNSTSSSVLVKADIDQKSNRRYGERIHWVRLDGQGCDFYNLMILFGLKIHESKSFQVS